MGESGDRTGCVEQGPSPLSSCYRTSEAMHRFLVGGFIKKVRFARVGEREVLLLDVRVTGNAPGTPPERVHVVVAAGIGVGVVGAEHREVLRRAMEGGASGDPGLWRGRLEGGRVLGVSGRGLALVKGGERSLVQLTKAPALEWRAPEARPELEQDGSPPFMGAESSEEALASEGARVAEALAGARASMRREALRRALAKALSRVARRAAAIEEDLSRTAEADAIAERARLFVAEAARAPRGATKLQATDWSSGEARAVELTLDPARGAREQIDALFERARRLKQGAHIASRRLEQTRAVERALREAAGALETTADGDLERLEARVRGAAPRDFRVASPGPGRGAERAAGRAPPYRTFAGPSGARILVGRGAAHNDALTFHVARPHDLWLHAKNRAGAHVIVPLEKGGSCPADALVEAAHLAAHFSEARDEGVVEVQYAPRRYLRKPRGSAPGLVVVDREKVLLLRREEALLRQLLERETEG